LPRRTPKAAFRRAAIKPTAAAIGGHSPMQH
jgi:hypothetical protein